jgi:putative DNA primase/helicase
MTMLEAAAAYAMEGISVFPCERKIPLTGNGGFKNASIHANQIVAWWTKYPEAQIGIPTGAMNHLFVIDVDGPEGEQAIQRMNLPTTRKIETRPGRFQLWFAQPDGITTKCTAGVLGRQLDSRGDGGYIVAPPSIHHLTKKPYRVVLDVPMAPVPRELLTVPTMGQAQSSIGDGIPEGQRHRTILSFVGSCRVRGMSAESILASARVLNQEKCNPPLDDVELQRLAGYVAKKPAGFRNQRPQETTADVTIKCMEDVAVENIEWLWQDRVPLGKLTLYVGDPSQGKSLATLDLAARFSRRLPFPDGARPALGSTILISAEDGAADTIKPRLLAAGADCSRIHVIEAVRVILPDGITQTSTFNLDRDLEKLEEVIRKLPDVKLFIVDPLSAYLGETVDSYRDSDVRRILTPLSAFAERLRIAVLGIMHLNKKDTPGALQRISSSGGFAAAARAIWGFGNDPDSKETHVMVPVKSNLAPLAPGLAYRIDGPVAHITWLPGAVLLNADTVFAIDRGRKAQDRVEETRNWLIDMLETAGGKVLAETIFERGGKAGFAQKTLYRAKRLQKIDSRKLGDAWWWFLPGQDGQPR